MDLEGKRLALLGFGVENRALGAWLAEHGLSFTLCDGDPAVRTREAPWDDAVTNGDSATRR